MKPLSSVRDLAAPRDCSECSRMATWFYSPGKGESDDFRCDEHVPRRCSCNIVCDVDGKETGEVYRDDLGREVPCVEWDMDPKGWAF